MTTCAIVLVGAWTALLAWGPGRAPGLLLGAVVVTTGVGAPVSVNYAARG